MLLPQSSAFAALKNRLNSVSNIGFLHGAPRRYAPSSSGQDRRPVLTSPTSTAQAGPPSYDRPSGTRLKSREENTIRWNDLLEKFKSVQERARRAAFQRHSLDSTDVLQNPSLTAALSVASTDRPRDRSGFEAPRAGTGMTGPGAVSGAGAVGAGQVGSRGVPDGPSKAGGPTSLLGSAHKPKSSLSNLSRLGMGGRKSKR